MKFQRKLWLVPVCIAALLLITCSPAFAYWDDAAFFRAENIIENPSFEEDYDYWEPENCFPEPGAAYTGETGMRIPMGETGILRQELNPPIDGEYEFNLHMRLDEQQASLLEVLFISDDGTKSYGMLYASPTSEWQRTGQTVYLSGPTVLEIRIAGTESDVFLDDLFLVPSESMEPPEELPDNLVSNSGFEAGISGWEQDHSAATSLSWANSAYEGRRSLQASATDQKPAVKTRLPAMELGEYEVTARLYVPGKVTSGSKLSMSLTTSKDDSWLRISSPVLTIPVSGEEGWITARFFVLLLPSEQYQLRVNGNEVSSFYVDEVSVCPTGYDASVPPEPDPEPVPIGVGNYSFENGLTSWTPTERLNIFTTNSQSFLGSSSAYFAYFEPSPMEQYLSQTCGAAGAGSYTLSARLRPDESLSGDGAVIVLEALDASGAVLSEATSTPVNNPSYGWQYTSATVDAPEGVASLRIKIGGKNMTGGFYADWVNLYRMP